MAAADRSSSLKATLVNRAVANIPAVASKAASEATSDVSSFDPVLAMNQKWATVAIAAVAVFVCHGKYGDSSAGTKGGTT